MKHLAIVGTGPTTRDNAPFDDLDFDIWTFNEAAQSEWCKRWDVLFQLHKSELYTGHNTKNARHWEWLQEKHGKPIFMQTYDERVPDSVTFPLDDVIALAGVRYIQSTVCYALGLAALYGYKRIDLYGIEMSFTEYQYQAENFRFWVGFCKGRGIEVNVHSQAERFFGGLLYGYEGNLVFGTDYFKQRAAEHDKDWHIKESNAKAYRRDLERALRRNDPQDFAKNVKAFHEAMRDTGELAGRLAEAERYAGFGDRIADRGGYEYAAAKSQQDGEAKRIEFYQTLGAMQYVWNIWNQTKNAQAVKQVEQFINQVGTLAYDTGAHLGMYRENIEYINRYDAEAKANGV